MAIRLVRRGPIIKNLIVFTFLSLIFLHIIRSLFHGVSALEFSSIAAIFWENKYLFLLLPITTFYIYKGSALSKYLYLVFILLITYKSMVMFFLSFNKTILVLNVLFILCSFYFFIFLKTELLEAVYIPGFNKRDVEKRPLSNIKVLINMNSGEHFEAGLTNWDEKSAFLLLSEDVPIKDGKGAIELNFANKKFSQGFVIVSNYEKGLGIRFIKDKKHDEIYSYGWNEFCAILEDRGFRPRGSV